MRPEQNGWHLADNIFEKDFFISIQITYPIAKKSALFQVMAWQHTGYKHSLELLMTQLNDAYMHHMASLSLHTQGSR